MFKLARITLIFAFSKDSAAVVDKSYDLVLLVNSIATSASVVTISSSTLN